MLTTTKQCVEQQPLPWPQARSLLDRASSVAFGIEGVQLTANIMTYAPRRRISRSLAWQSSRCSIEHCTWARETCIHVWLMLLQLAINRLKLIAW